MKIYGNQCQTMKSLGNIRKSFECYALGILEIYTTKSLKTNEESWKSMKLEILKIRKIQMNSGNTVIQIKRKQTMETI